MNCTGDPQYTPTRAQVRQDTIEVLAAAGIVPDGHVYPPMDRQWTDEELPGLSVMVQHCNEAVRGMGAPLFRRTLDVVVTVVVAEDDDRDLDDTLDAAVEQVRAALLTNDLWMAQFEAVNSVDTIVAYQAVAGRNRAAAAMTFTTQDTTALTMQRVDAAVDLDTVAVTVKTGGAHAPPVEFTIDRTDP